MAKVLDVVLAAGALRDALFGKSGQTGDVGRKQFILARHLQLEDAAQAFSAAPASGAESPDYDAAVGRCRGAAKAIEPLSASVDAELNRIGAEADAGVAALQAITAAASASASSWRVRGVLRLRTDPARRDVGVATAGGSPAGGGADPVLSRLAKLFPAEAVSVYTTGAALLHGRDQADPAVPSIWWFPLLVALALIVFRTLATQPSGGGKPQIAAIAAAVISFLLWVVTLGDWFLPGAPPGAQAPLIAGAIGGVWVWVAPLVVERIDGPGR
jgi:hypothetical protein